MTAPAGGWGASELPGESRRAADHSGARRLLRRLVEVVAEPVSPQERLDRIVSIIAANLVADVCSIYILRAGDVLELFASHGLAPEAVHRTRLVVGEGLVGTIAAQGEVINTSDAQAHPDFVYRPETGEEVYHSFLGVPIVRSGRVLGVLVVQNRTRRVYDEDEVEALQIIASVLAEMLGSGGIVDPARYGDVGLKPLESLRLEGVRLVDGIGIGRAWLHEPRVEVVTIVADDPTRELHRLEEAIDALRRNLDATLERSDPGFGEHREILEAYRMFADDSGWQRRIREAVETGLTAEAAVRRVQEETRLRLGHASDPYLRERLTDLDELANRLLLHLAGRDPAREAAALPPDSIIVARNMTAAELIEYDREKVRGVILEEGSTTAHVTIVARAFGLPMIGRVEGAMAQIEAGDLIALDGDHGQAFVRPGEDVLESFRRVARSRAARSQALEA
ncbi:MAG TPA: GAF domain-containing protein, partial [Rhodospirillales bacterium]|nr:GAF domain-containing protein [Rhodospirillales bacterium]